MQNLHLDIQYNSLSFLKTYVKYMLEKEFWGILLYKGFVAFKLTVVLATLTYLMF